MRYKTTITIVCFTAKRFIPDDIQEIANMVEHESSEGSITDVVSAPDLDSEQNNRPVLEINLSGPDGNIFVVMATACQFLGKDQASELRDTAMQQHSYEDALQIINAYVHLVDTSNAHGFK